jgi:hypothetical protein
MRKLLTNEKGNVGTIILAVATAITIAVSIIIVYSILGGMDVTTIDSKLDGTPAKNATNSLIAGLSTFFTISPIYLIVLVAVAIIGAVMGIMYVGKRQ